MADEHQSESQDTPTSVTEPSLPEVLWQHLRGVFDNRVFSNLSSYVRLRGVSRWVIATDFCIGDSSRPNDSFAFVILPADRHLLDSIECARRDLKQVKRPPPALIRVLRKGKAFSICFVVDRDRKVYTDSDAARSGIDATLKMIERWKDAPGYAAAYGRIKLLRSQMEKKSANLKLLTDIILCGVFSAFVIYLLVCTRSADKITWVADRDKITEAYSRIVDDMLSFNVGSLCDRESLPRPALEIVPHNGDRDADKIARLADYIAGPAAAYDPPSFELVTPKIAVLLREVFADNKYACMIRVAFGIVDGQFHSEASRLQLSRRPLKPGQQPGCGPSGSRSLRGRSRAGPAGSRS